MVGYYKRAPVLLRQSLKCSYSTSFCTIIDTGKSFHGHDYGYG